MKFTDYCKILSGVNLKRKQQTALQTFGQRVREPRKAKNPGHRKRVLQRPEAFRKLAALDHRSLDLVLAEAEPRAGRQQTAEPEIAVKVARGRPKDIFSDGGDGKYRPGAYQVKSRSLSRMCSGSESTSSHVVLS